MVLGRMGGSNGAWLISTVSFKAFESCYLGVDQLEARKIFCSSSNLIYTAGMASIEAPGVATDGPGGAGSDYPD